MKKIGIIGAMDLEIALLRDKMDVKRTITKSNMIFYEGLLCGKNIVLVQCGIGKVNAGICTQILADMFEVDAIINTGVAGGLLSEINIGDIVISTDAVEHDMDVTVLGYAKGQIPEMDIFSFVADEQLRALAKKVNEQENPDICTYEGRVLSGDQFISDNEIKEFLVNELHGTCTEMEGAAIAHVAYLNNIPFVVIRSISDKADGSAEMDYPKFKVIAAAHSSRLVMEMVNQL